MAISHISIARLFWRCAALLLLPLTVRGEQVVFSEVMYNPPVGKPEFIEVWNITNTPLDTARWSFNNGVAYTFPDFNAGASQAHFLKPLERIVISSAAEGTTRAAYPSIPANVRVFGPWSGNLANGGERVTLIDRNNVIVCTLRYRNDGHWPRAADGTGHSLVLRDENQAIDDWRVWRASVNNGGSPGVADPTPAVQALTLSEAHFTATNQVDWVELRNNSAASASANGLFLSSTSNFSNKVALAGSVSSGGHVSYPVAFPTNGSNQITLYLIDSGNNVRDAVKLSRVAGRDSMQRFPPASTEWYSSISASQNAANNPDRTTAIVINEIMADPPSNQRDGEFIELYNRSGASVDLSGWRLEEAVDFTFPGGTAIPPGGYLVIGANAAWLGSAYSGLVAIGNWSGVLRNSGENVRLLDATGNLVDEVDYRIGGEWPERAGGNGSSLELVHPDADNSLGTAWQDSDESQKGVWKSFTINGGTYSDLTQGGVNDDEIRIWAPGDSHIILRSLVIKPTSGSGNLFTNASVTTLNNNNLDGWQARGTHWASYHDAEGVHLVADGHGDNKCNHIEKDATGMFSGTSYTMTFEARWVSGKPRLVAQSWDMSWGGVALVPIPLNLGTPGAANSTALPMAPPLVTDGSHSPLVPKTGQTVTIAARVTSSVPLSGVVLRHRLDNINGNAAWASTAMNDSGTGGDARANDGIYSVQINPASFSGYNSNGAIVQFYVEATATNAQTGTFPRRADAAPGQWLVDNQTVSGDLRSMRVIISAYWGDALNTPDASSGGGSFKFNYKFPRFNNHYFPCTFIHNESVVYYGSSVRKTGSPFTRENDNNLTRGRISLAGDQPFRGKTKLYWDNDGSGGTMLHNRIHRYWLYLLGVPGNENEVCRVGKNNGIFNVRETSEVFDKDMLDRIWENGSAGQFYEMDDKFWIGDDGHTRLNNSNGSWDYDPPNSPGAENPTSYHNNFTPKSREWEYDYSALLGWCQQLEQVGGGLTPEKLERMADVRAMCAYAAVRGYTADWDNITMSRGKNGFFYNRSTDHRWTFLHWDSDLAFQSGHINDSVIGGLTNVSTFYGIPYVRRYLNHYLTQMIGPLAANGPRISAWLAAEEAASPAYIVPSTYANWPTTSNGSNTRHSVIQSFIGSSLTLPFVLTSPATTTSANTVTINGRAPTAAFRIECVGHPEASLIWTSVSTTDVSPWRLSGILLANGSNLLTFRMYNEEGVQIGSDLNHTVTKTGNAPPVIRVAAAPASLNVAIGQPITIDASGSYDPETAGPLSFVWTVTPAASANVTALSAGSRSMVFTTPGSYSVTIEAVDADAQVATQQLAISVYHTGDFDSFDGDYLADYTLQSVKLRDNDSPNTWYSLNETEGRLVVQITETVALPLTNNGASFPRITRPLPATDDFALQTSYSLETRQFGNFATGLFIETVQGGTLYRYAFGLSGGNTMVVYRATGTTGGFALVHSSAYAGGDITTRIVRSGTSLSFQRRINGAWTNLYSTALIAGSTASSGGLFAMTSSPQSIRVAFDYLLVSDPGNTNDLLNYLRISEIMYAPPAGGVEFLELTNIGAVPLNLEGVYFEEGNPFSKFTFGAIMLNPGQFVVVTSDIVTFQNLYPGVAVAGQFSGALDNSGERIVLKDPDGYVIHDFIYGSLAPWPVQPKGTGVSLEILFANASYSDPANWRAGVEMNGSPGSLGAGFDTDGDGHSDRSELILGTDWNDGSSYYRITNVSRDLAGNVTLTWPSAQNLSYRIDYTTGMSPPDWLPLGTVPSAGATTTYIDNTAPGQPQRFYRAVALIP